MPELLEHRNRRAAQRTRLVEVSAHRLQDGENDDDPRPWHDGVAHFVEHLPAAARPHVRRSSTEDDRQCEVTQGAGDTLPVTKPVRMLQRVFGCLCRSIEAAAICAVVLPESTVGLEEAGVVRVAFEHGDRPLGCLPQHLEPVCRIGLGAHAFEVERDPQLEPLVSGRPSLTERPLVDGAGMPEVADVPGRCGEREQKLGTLGMALRKERHPAVPAGSARRPDRVAWRVRLRRPEARPPGLPARVDVRRVVRAARDTGMTVLGGTRRFRRTRALDRRPPLPARQRTARVAPHACALRFRRMRHRE